MKPADVRLKWNRRYHDKLAQGDAPEPHPLVLRFVDEVRGGTMLDAACGLGAGIAAALGRVDRAIGVDLSETAIGAARARWRAREDILWIHGDVARMAWPAETFTLVTALGFTDWDFLRQVSRIVRPGGLFLYQGFSRRQLEAKPQLDPDWTSTPDAIAALVPGWRVLVAEETGEAPYRVRFAATCPADAA